MWSCGWGHCAVVIDDELFTAGDNMFAQTLRPQGDGWGTTRKRGVRGVVCDSYSTFTIEEDGVWRSGPLRRIIEERVRSFAAVDGYYAFIDDQGVFHDSEDNEVEGIWNEVKAKGDWLVVANDHMLEVLAPIELQLQVHLPIFDVSEKGVWWCEEGDNTITNNEEEVISFPSEVLQIACSGEEVLVLLGNGEVWNKEGRVKGIPSNAEAIYAEEEVFAVYCGSGGWCVWGNNRMDKLGTGDTRTPTFLAI